MASTTFVFTTVKLICFCITFIFKEGPRKYVQLLRFYKFNLNCYNCWFAGDVTAPCWWSATQAFFHLWDKLTLFSFDGRRHIRNRRGRLGTRLQFHVNSAKKIRCIEYQHGRLFTRLQTKNWLQLSFSFLLRILLSIFETDKYCWGLKCNKWP